MQEPNESTEAVEVDALTDQPAPVGRPAPEPHELRLGSRLSLHATPEQRIAFFTALAKAQGAFAEIPRNKHVSYKTKGGDLVEYDYAELGTVITATRGALAANGIAYIAPLAGDGEEDIHTLLTHESGAFFHSIQSIPFFDKQQEKISYTTFARRGQYQCVVGVAPEYDDDGNAGDGRPAVGVTDKPRSAPKAADKPPARKPEFLPASADELELVKVLSDQELIAMTSKRLDDLRVPPNQLARGAKIREVAGADYAQLDRAAREQLAVTLGKMAVQS